jgi:hypothetical protein
MSAKSADKMGINQSRIVGMLRQNALKWISFVKMRWNKFSNVFEMLLLRSSPPFFSTSLPRRSLSQAAAHPLSIFFLLRNSRVKLATQFMAALTFKSPIHYSDFSRWSSFCSFVATLSDISWFSFSSSSSFCASVSYVCCWHRRPNTCGLRPNMLVSFCRSCHPV